MVILFTTWTLVILWIPDSARPSGAYGELDVKSLRIYDGNIEICVKSGGTGAPVKTLYIEMFYGKGYEKICLNTTLEYFEEKNITIPLEKEPNLILIHYLDIFNNEERTIEIRVSNTPNINETHAATPLLIISILKRCNPY